MRQALSSAREINVLSRNVRKLAEILVASRCVCRLDIMRELAFLVRFRPRPCLILTLTLALTPTPAPAPAPALALALALALDSYSCIYVLVND